MGDRTTNTILSVLLILAIVPFSINDAFAVDYKKHVTAEDLGILQLAAHDLFNVSRCDHINPECAVDFEDSKLNLSTLFVDTVDPLNAPFDNATIAIGGESRNRENIMLFTVASDLGSYYVELVDDGVEKSVAKQNVIDMYHERLADTYLKTFGESFPPIDTSTSTEEELFQENLAFRTVHDYLPGKIKFNKKSISIFDPSLKGEKLDQKELQQKSSKLDGKFDEEFRHIDICFPPPNEDQCIMVDLLDADRSFGVQFGTTEDFDDFLEELEDGIYDDDDSVMSHIRNLIAKGQNF